MGFRRSAYTYISLKCDPDPHSHTNGDLSTFLHTGPVRLRAWNPQLIRRNPNPKDRGRFDRAPFSRRVRGFAAFFAARSFRALVVG